MTKVLQTLIKMYAYAVSPFLGRNCRFHPTCSCYTHQALEKHGALKGLYLGARRILRCHPWYKGDYVDEVPSNFEWRFPRRIDPYFSIGYKQRKSK